MQQSYTHSVNDLLSRLKSGLNIDNDAQLARLINIAPNTLGNWKARNSVDFPLIITFCVQQGLDVNWILTGIKKEVETVNEPMAAYGGDQSLLIASMTRTIALLEDRLAKSEATLKEAQELITQKEHAEQRLKETQAELIKVQAQLIESQKKTPKLTRYNRTTQEKEGRIIQLPLFEFL